MMSEAAAVALNEMELHHRAASLDSFNPHNVARYKPVEQVHVDKLIDYITSAQPHELYRFTPLYLAARAGYDQHTMLELLARAVLAGILDLNWEVHCAYCQMPLHDYRSLAEANSKERCPHCGEFDNHLDRDVWVSFTISPRILALPDDVETATLDHVMQMYEDYGIVSGAELLNVQFFRDFFTDQVMPIDQSLQVQRLSLIFSDLRGSTPLYARSGDPRAFKLVRDHYAVLFDAVNRHGGSVVKTMGDAIMATFVHSADALAAAIDFQRDIATFNRANNLNAEDALLLKVGVHSGPCLAVNLNDRLDYFGTTVNIASRIEAMSQAGLVLVSATTMDEIATDSETFLQPLGSRQLRRYPAHLRGVDNPVVVCEIEVSLPHLPAARTRTTEAALTLCGEHGLGYLPVVRFSYHC
jgi:class 3 adenylate cyclase